jgi:hypothetical protein
MKEKTMRIIYVGISIILFCFGTWAVPALSIFPKEPRLPWYFSGLYLSGLSLSSWFLSIAMFVDWLKCRKETVGGIWLKIGTLVLVGSAVVLYPPTIRMFLSFVDYASLLFPFVIGYAILTAISGAVVYLLGLNSSKIKRESKGDRENTIRFLLSIITVFSLVSIGTNFALSSSSYTEAVGPSVVRVIVVSSYLVLPVVAYSLGYLARQLDLPLAEGLTFSLCLLLVFTIGAIAVSIVSFNNFFFSAGVTWFLTIGMFLGLFERSNGFSNRIESGSICWSARVKMDFTC